jgi:hypothetical protein
MNHDPMFIHEEAWKTGVTEAIHDKFSKYALYATRVLSLYHPEILLKADSRFIDHITMNRGYSNSYEVKDVHSREFLTDMQFRKYPPFKFDAVDFDAFKIVKFNGLYPDDYPIQYFLDRRIQPVASTLKTRENEVTEFEKAALLYQRQRIADGNVNDLFIIHCDNEKTYLSENGVLIDAINQEKITKLNGNPVLIFNEEYVWYPVMERDDTNKSTTLKRIVEKVANEESIPSLTPFEKGMVESLKDVTKLTDARQKAMAEICCCRSTGRQTCTTPLSEWFPFHSIWDIALPAKKARAWQYYGYLEQILIRANKLSPIAAYLASLSLKSSGYDKLVVLYKEWITRVALPGYSYVWGHLWDECFVEYSIDESFRTSAGHCMVQGMIMSAVLEMLGIDNYLMEGEVPGSHHYVWIPAYEATFDNSKLKMSMKNVMLDWPRGNKVLARFHHNGKFCSPISGGEYSGSFTPKECVEELDALAGTYGNKLLIYANGKHETEPTVQNRNNRAITDDYKQILKEDWEDLVLP